MAIVPPVPPESQIDDGISPVQAQLLRRIRRMYVEKVIENSEKVAYDERVDMKASVPTPAAHLATALAHMAAACYWVVAFVLTTAFAVHFNSFTAKRWAYSCL